MQLSTVIFFIIIQVGRLHAQSEVTYPGIGHFTTNDYKDPTLRPKVVLPQSPQQMNTRFLLYSRQNPSMAQVLTQGNSRSIGNSNFVSTRITKFIVHGFTDNQLFVKWMNQMKDQFLNAGDYNVFVVDWSGGNGWPYEQATANARVVGPVMALFINELKSTSGLDLNDVHIVGHSLGAHIGGYAGQTLNGQLGRITGLDPSGPDFDGLPSSAKLDPTDAKFVDAIHTDAKFGSKGYGTYETFGHLDFYPNGGKDPQPGCRAQILTSFLTFDPVESARRLIYCSHQRAVDFYTATINANNRKGVGHQCSDYDAYLRGQCNDCGTNGSKCAIIGEQAVQSHQFADSTRGNRFFLTTRDTSPYF